ncbi:ATP-binding protein [Streptomyces sp. NPDC002920]
MLQDAYADGGRPLRSDERSFGSCPAAAAAARQFVTGAVAHWGITERSDDIQLCVSEMSTNAVVHAASQSGFTLRLLAWARFLRVEVEDHGAGLPVQRAARLEGTSGRGLLLVEALSDDWGVVDGQGGKTVWCDFRLKHEADWSVEQLDAAAAHPVREWCGSAVEHKAALRVLGAGDLSAVTTYDDEAHYVLSARPMPTASFLECSQGIDPEVLQADSILCHRLSPRS